MEEEEVRTGGKLRACVSPSACDVLSWRREEVTEDRDAGAGCRGRWVGEEGGATLETVIRKKPNVLVMETQ